MGPATSKPEAATSKPEAGQLPSLTMEDVWKYYEQIGDQLGKGGFADVYKGRRRTEHPLYDDDEADEFAIKVVNVKQFVASVPESERQRLMEQFLREASNWRKIDHPNVVKLYEALLSGITSEVIVMELELADGGDLASFLESRRNEPLSEAMKKRWCLQLLLGLQSIHKEGIVHRDISANNVLLFGNKEEAVLKITDFGLTRDDFEPGHVPSDYFATRLQIGNCPYAPPEFTKYDRDQPRDKLSDIWSLGVVFYFIEERHLPFDDKDPHEICALINRYAANPRPLSFANASTNTSLRDMIEHMLVPDRSTRAKSVEELLQHRFLRQSLQVVAFDDKEDSSKADAIAQITPSSSASQPAVVISPLKLIEHAFDAIAQMTPSSVNLPAAIISMSGSYRSGKSLLMSLFVRYLEQLEECHGDHEEAVRTMKLQERLLTEFEAKASANVVTNGIHLWSHPFEINKADGSKVAVYLMDTEGTRARTEKVTVEDIKDRDTRILILTSIASSMQFYNVNGKLNIADIADIEQFNFYLRILAEQTDGLKPVGTLMQTLLFLFRNFEDFPADIGEEFGFVTARRYAKDNPAGFDKLRNFFEKLEYFAMPQPPLKVRGREQYNNLLKVSDLKGGDGDFVGCATDLFKWAIDNAKPLNRGGLENMKLSDAKGLLKEYIRSMNDKGKLEPICEALAKMKHSEAVKELLVKYDKDIRNEFRDLIKPSGSGSSSKLFVSGLKKIKFKDAQLRLKSAALTNLLSRNLPMKDRFINESQAELERKIERHCENWNRYFDRWIKISAAVMPHEALADILIQHGHNVAACVVALGSLLPLIPYEIVAIVLTYRLQVMDDEPKLEDYD